MSAVSPIIVWFQKDLRLADNPALFEACKTGQPLIFLYILDEVSPDIRPLGGASRWWLHYSLLALQERLAGVGGQLVVRRGDSFEVLQEVVRETGAAGVYWNRCYDKGRQQLLKRVKAHFSGQGVEAQSFNGSLLVEPWDVKTNAGDPYKVFTPFWKSVRSTYQLPDILPAPDKIQKGPEVAGECIEDLDLLPTQPDWAAGLRGTWTPGETRARTRLAGFLEGGLKGYKDARNRPDKPGTSMLSPHLHWGEISPRQAWQALDLHTKGEMGADAECFLSELGWREFSYSLLYHWPDIATKNWKQKFDDFPWEKDEALLKRWQQGQTGIPIVDAGMRQLWHTGWMHNRVRMIVASLLIKNLRIHWREGEAWFWDTLVDADLANNAAGWQWVAGSGADAAPYFRIFNPVSQGERFDPNGEYVRKWVPELASLPNKSIHQPWTIEHTCEYPQPIVDLAESRKVALESYKNI